jgi:hypothetical protein
MMSIANYLTQYKNMPFTSASKAFHILPAFYQLRLSIIVGYTFLKIALNLLNQGNKCHNEIPNR